MENNIRFNPQEILLNFNQFLFIVAIKNKKIIFEHMPSTLSYCIRLYQWLYIFIKLN